MHIYPFNDVLCVSFFSFCRSELSLCIWFLVLLRGVSPDATGNSWIKMNAGQSGYYRVNYDEGNWNNLKKQLNSDHTVNYQQTKANLSGMRNTSRSVDQVNDFQKDL